MIGYGGGLIFVIFFLHKISLRDTNNFYKNTESHELVSLYFGLLILMGIPPFIGFILKVMVLNLINRIRSGLVVVMAVISLSLIFAYLIIVFYLLRFARTTSCKINNRKVKSWRLDLFYLNMLIRVLILTII
jgi:formate hydrogenlyase subunit 3/multisubunit Na+/H+ antiporter MnhD subunit